MITRRIVGAVLLAVAAAGAVTGTFQDLYQLRMSYSGANQIYSASSWAYTFETFGPTADTHPARYGLPVTVAAAVLLVAALLVLANRQVGRVLAIAGAAGLAGAVWSAAESYLSILSELQNEAAPEAAQGEVVAGDGLFLMIVAVGVAAIGIVLSRVRQEPAPEPEGTVIHQFDDADETDTPPYGIPVQQEEKA